jgi:hypothetical protein
MDHAGVEWQYEPEGFKLDGLWYLPDFYLPRLKVWLEIKHDLKEWDPDYIPVVDKAFRLNRHTGLPALILEDVPEHQNKVQTWAWGYTNECADPGEYYSFAWTSCLRCKRTGLGNFGEFFVKDAPDDHPDPFVEMALMPCGHHAYGTLPRVLEALQRARAARFEHGERP